MGWDLAACASRADAFGARVLEVEGHDLVAVDDAFTKAVDTDDQPTVILARTIKARGFSEVEDREGWHGKALPADMAARAIA
ncbi:MAG TPA: transketolase, partial [Nocardioides sp.]|nr:transketolase [Nocardioides sp.]